MAYPDELVPGDVVSVNMADGKQEGIVIGSRFDHVGRQVVEVQFNNHRVYPRAWYSYPLVHRVRRGYPAYQYGHAPSVERHIHYY
ncbi:hypothetical protein FRC03_002505 [Tulasnella sp. 419]|nr:hypothetical protein FRC02_005695 [Tulasnella sp. 418]KAG8943394.1 hypothetical protein FRC03_002505 [Tulasnella sp. 419]